MADLMAALRNADAAGDVEAATRIAAMIREQKAQLTQNNAHQEYLKKLAQDQSPLQAGLISAGRGMTKLASWAGLVDGETEIEKKAFQALEEESPIATTIGETIGESAPFLIPGAGQAGLVAKLGGGTVARLATAGGLGALEAGIIADANDQDAAQAAGLGAGFAAGAEFLFPKIGKAYRKFRGIAPETNLVDVAGNITAPFEKALADEGLTVGNLVDAVRADLPKIAADAGESGKARLSEALAAKEAAKAVVKRQIQAGARDNELAPLMIMRNKVVNDNLAEEAIKQGFEKGTVQLAKATNKETKSEMVKGLKLAFDIKNNSSLAQTSRPSDFAGKALYNEVKYIKEAAKSAASELDNIAKTQLKDMDFDHSVVNSAISDIFKKLDIDNVNPRGIPTPNFKGSQISGDKSSQRAITELIRILSESKRGDALGAHMMKRQLDRLINYQKKDMFRGGLGDDGEKAIKAVRKALNDGIRVNSPDYARVNDVMSMAFDSLEDLQTAVGKRINLSVDSANSALGTSIRNIFSNNQKREELKDAFNKIDDVALKLGGDFKVNYRDLFQFTREIENIFEPAAKTSFAGEILGATKAAARGDKMGFVEGLGAAGLNKLRDVNDYNAYKSMRELLQRTADE